MSRSSVLALVLVFTACAPSTPARPSVDPNADVVVPYAVGGGGVIRFTVHPHYVAGSQVDLVLDVQAGTLRIRGPLSGRVLASGLAGEKVVRTLGPTTLEAVDVAPHDSAHTTVVWDGRDDAGEPVSADTYSLALDFIVGAESLRVGSVIQITSR